MWGSQGLGPLALAVWRENSKMVPISTSMVKQDNKNGCQQCLSSQREPSCLHISLVGAPRLVSVSPSPLVYVLLIRCFCTEFPDQVSLCTSPLRVGFPNSLVIFLDIFSDKSGLFGACLSCEGSKDWGT